MKLLAIPDINENLEFLKYIMAVEDTARFDHIILLGDKFKGHPLLEHGENTWIGGILRVSAELPTSNGKPGYVKTREVDFSQ